MSTQTLADRSAWNRYLANVVAHTEGNDGGDVPPCYPCIVVTDVQYHGSVSSSADDYTVTHTFITPDDARAMLALSPQTPPHTEGE